MNEINKIRGKTAVVGCRGWCGVTPGWTAMELMALLFMMLLMMQE